MNVRKARTPVCLTAFFASVPSFLPAIRPIHSGEQVDAQEQYDAEYPGADGLRRMMVERQQRQDTEYHQRDDGGHPPADKFLHRLLDGLDPINMAVVINKEMQRQHQQEGAAESRDRRMRRFEMFGVFLGMVQRQVEHLGPGQVGRQHDDQERKDDAHAEYGDDHADGQEHLLPERRQPVQDLGIDDGVVKAEGQLDGDQDQGDDQRPGSHEDGDSEQRQTIVTSMRTGENTYRRVRMKMFMHLPIVDQNACPLQSALDLFAILAMEQSRIRYTRHMDMRPLAERMRPETLADVVGQKHLVGAGKIIRQIIEQKQPTSLILWGPPAAARRRWRASSPARRTPNSWSFRPSQRQGGCRQGHRAGRAEPPARHEDHPVHR
jgi:hypothetical protein